MPRLFTGLALPEAIRDQLAALEAPLSGANWIDFDNLHLTLRFVGDVNHQTAREFSDMLAGISQDAFLMRLSGLGTFGGKEPHTLYAGVQTNPALDALARANERAAVSAGLTPSRRAFKPHVTLARLKYTRPDFLARYLGRLGAFRSSSFFVTEFDLFSARPHTGGGPYVREETFTLFGSDYANMKEFDTG
ncbi:MAG: RNA 2',3'-cyclic phosphodiesterase [Hyphomicrobiaceae bacterium]